MRSKLASSDTSETGQGRERVLKQEVGPRALGVAVAAVWGGQGPPSGLQPTFAKSSGFSQEKLEIQIFFFK